MRSFCALVFHHQAAQNLAVQAAQRRRGEHAFRRAARSHHRVYAGAGDRRGDAGREIAVADQADARARLADVGDQLLVPRAVEHHDDQIVHAALQAAGDGLEVAV